MHPIWLARLDKTRPVLLLTREEVRAVRRLVTVAPITTTILGLSSEVRVDARNGIDQESVVNVDSVVTVPRETLIRPLGALLAAQEVALTRAIHAGFDLTG